MAKIRNFDSFFGLYSHISAPINVKFSTGSRLLGQDVAPVGRKTHFWTTE